MYISPKKLGYGFPLEAPLKLILMNPHVGCVKWLGEEVKGLIAQEVSNSSMDDLISSMLRILVS